MGEMIKQHITKEQLEELSLSAAQKLATWFRGKVLYNDDLVRVYIPEERVGKHDGVFTGQWDKLFEFNYPYEHTGKLKVHQGLILPLLDIGQMLDFLYERRINLVSAESSMLCDVLWNAVKREFEWEGG